MFIITLSLISLHCIQKACVVCNKKTLFFCIGFSFDTVGGMVHLWNPKRDKGRSCWKKLHDSRYSANPDRNMLSKKRKAQPSEQSKRKKPRKETKRSSLNPVFIWLFLRRIMSEILFITSHSRPNISKYSESIQNMDFEAKMNQIVHFPSVGLRRKYLFYGSKLTENHLKTSDFIIFDT